MRYLAAGKTMDLARWFTPPWFAMPPSGFTQPRIRAYGSRFRRSASVGHPTTARALLEAHRRGSILNKLLWLQISGSNAAALKHSRTKATPNLGSCCAMSNVFRAQGMPNGSTFNPAALCRISETDSMQAKLPLLPPLMIG